MHLLHCHCRKRIKDISAKGGQQGAKLFGGATVAGPLHSHTNTKLQTRSWSRHLWLECIWTPLCRKQATEWLAIEEHTPFNFRTKGGLADYPPGWKAGASSCRGKLECLRLGAHTITAMCLRDMRHAALMCAPICTCTWAPLLQGKLIPLTFARANWGTAGS